MRASINSIAIILAIASSGSHADFYGRKAEGWHWYAETEEISFDEKPVKPEPEKPAPKKPEDKTEHETEEKGPAPLSHDWVKQNLPMFLTRAIDDPTPENARAYLYLQRIANDKAEEFAEAAQLAIMKDPYLSEVDRQPTSTMGANLFSKEAKENSQVVMGTIAGMAELWYFFKGEECGECEAQWGIIEELKRRHGFNVRAISVDGKSSPVIGESIPDKGQFKALGLSYLPTLLMARPPDSLVPIAIGISPLGESEKKITRLAADEGWISDELWESTRSVRPSRAMFIEEGQADENDLESTEGFLRYIDQKRK